MKTFSMVSECIMWRKQTSSTIGLVPTMGSLHDGHISLVEKSLKTCKKTVVSIFVNPTQFTDANDFKNYPISIKQDLQLLETYNVDAVFIPSSEEMYKKHHSISVSENKLSHSLEGKSRVGHFDGVCTIVAKLFNLFQPSHAFFGQKDAQQLLIIQAMVEQLNYQVTIIPCETIREQNGLAMSSRNSHLSAQQKMEASKIYHALVDAKSVILNGETNVLKIKQKLFDALNSIPNSKIDYISIANINTLIEVETEVKGTVLISLAVYVGKVRLIDNIICS